MEVDNNKIKNLCCNEAFISLVSSLGVIAISNIFLASVNSISIDMNESKDNVVIEKELVDADLHDIASEKSVTQEKILVKSYYEDIDLTYEDSYSGMALSNEFEDGIKILAQEYELDYEIVLTVGEWESRGKWDNNGVISKTNDYGVFQINECNLDYIERNLGYTKEEVLYEPIKNAEACIFLLDGIINIEDVNTLEDIFGMYNGWTSWEQKSQSVEYVNSCCDIIDDYFEDYQYVKKKTY